jgi:hypothetical protein
MIEELSRFGIPISIVESKIDGKLTGSSVITIICACGLKQSLKVASIVRTIRRVGFYRCVSCGMKVKHQNLEYQKSHRAGIIESWSEGRRQDRSNISKIQWKDDVFRTKITNASNKFWHDINKRLEASEKTKALWNDPLYLAKQNECNKIRAITSSQAAHEMWSRPEYIQQQLKFKSGREHVELQSILAKERWNDPEYREMVIESLHDYYSSIESRVKISEFVKCLWQDPKYIEKQVIANADPDLSKLKSDNAKKQWGDPEIRQKIIDGIKEVWKDPVYKAEASEISKRRWMNDEFREKQALARANILTNGKDSILERIAQNVLGTLQIPYVRHHVVGYFEFDLFIPSHNVLVECNGEYWHSLRKSKDAAKFTYVDKYFPQYKILYLWERDFLNPGLIHKKLVESLSLELATTKLSDFEFCDIRIQKMNTKDIMSGSYYSAAEEFLQSYHYSGYGRSAKSVYGAYLGSELIGICKFSSPMRAESATSMGFTQQQVLELDRFCIHPCYQKKNFASWLLSRCVKYIFNGHPGVEVLISFSDLTLGHLGTIYKASNWKELHKTKPDYHYVSSDGFVIHKKTLYDHASRNGKSEIEYANEYGYNKVFGREKTKFCFYRTKSMIRGDAQILPID